MSEALITATFLSLAGGLADAYTYTMRDGVFANAETGNVILFSLAIFKQDWPTALRYLTPILFFSIGILAADFIRDACRDTKSLHWRQIVLVFEIAIFFIVGFIPTEFNIIANSVIGFTCAMQVQAFRKVDGRAFASTMCTGNLRSGMDAFYLFLKTRKAKNLYTAFHYFGVIALFGIGAGLGSIYVKSFGLKTIWISCALLLISFFLMFVKEEREEMEFEELKMHLYTAEELKEIEDAIKKYH